MPGRRPTRQRLSGAGVAAAIVADAAVTSGVRPFSEGAYVSLAVPVVLVGVLALLRRRRRAGPVDLVRALPFAVVFLLGTALEVLALSLGGRSPAVPTLSTVFDRAIALRGLRAAFIAAWLSIGVVPSLRRLGRTA